MRFRCFVICTLTVLASATIQAGNDVVIPDPVELSIADQHPKQIEPSNIKFVIGKKGCTGAETYRGTMVFGVVSKNVDLAGPDAVGAILLGLQFGREQCPNAGSIGVWVRFGDPNTFTDEDQAFKWPQNHLNSLFDTPEDVVQGEWIAPRSDRLVYWNWPLVNKVQRDRQAKAARAELARRQAEANAENEETARTMAVLKK